MPSTLDRIRQLTEDMVSHDEIIMHLVNSFPDGILIVDRDMNIKFANQRACEIFSYDNGLEGRAVNDLIPPTYRKQHVKDSDEYMNEPTKRRMAGRNVAGLRQDGSEVPVSITLSPVTDTGYVVASIREVLDV